MDAAVHTNGMIMKMSMMDGFVQMLIANIVRIGRSMNIVVTSGRKEIEVCEVNKID